MTTILLLDTANKEATVGIAQDGNVIAHSSCPNPKETQVFIHEHIIRLLAKLQLTTNDIDAICVITGPGSYTNLRIGIASVQGLALGMRKPIIAISSLRLMAFVGIHTHNLKQLICLVHARAEEFYASAFDKDYLIDMEDDVTIVDNSFFEAGSSLPLIAHVHDTTHLTQMGVKHLHIAIDLQHLASLALQYYEQAHFTDINKLNPLYVRNPYIKD